MELLLSLSVFALIPSLLIVGFPCLEISNCLRIVGIEDLTSVTELVPALWFWAALLGLSTTSWLHRKGVPPHCVLALGLFLNAGGWLIVELLLQTKWKAFGISLLCFSACPVHHPCYKSVRDVMGGWKGQIWAWISPVMFQTTSYVTYLLASRPQLLLQKHVFVYIVAGSNLTTFIVACVLFYHRSKSITATAKILEDSQPPSHSVLTAILLKRQNRPLESNWASGLQLLKYPTNSAILNGETRNLITDTERSVQQKVLNTSCHSPQRHTSIRRQLLIYIWIWAQIYTLFMYTFFVQDMRDVKKNTTPYGISNYIGTLSVSKSVFVLIPFAHIVQKMFIDSQIHSLMYPRKIFVYWIILFIGAVSAPFIEVSIPARGTFIVVSWCVFSCLPTAIASVTARKLLGIPRSWLFYYYPVELAVEQDQAKYLEMSSHLMVVVLILLKILMHTKLPHSLEIKVMAYIGMVLTVLAFVYPVYVLMGFSESDHDSTKSKKDSILTVDWWRPTEPPRSSNESKE